MKVEQSGGVVLYQFNWVEQLVPNAVLKHLDRQRRRGVSDELPIHSATRAIFTDDVPHDDRLMLVRWIVDEDEYLGAGPDEACPAPMPRTLVDLMEYAQAEIVNGSSAAYNRPIGRLTLAQSGRASRTTYRSETLAAFAVQIQQFSRHHQG